MSSTIILSIGWPKPKNVNLTKKSRIKSTSYNNVGQNRYKCISIYRRFKWKWCR